MTSTPPDPAAVVLVDIDALTLDPDNVRKHGADQVQRIADSLKAFGWMVPVTADAQNKVIAGHGRILAARLLGQTQVPVLHRHLDDAKRRAYAVADNRLAERSFWDDAALPDLLLQIEGDGLLDLTGFDAGDIEQMNFSGEPDSPATVKGRAMSSAARGVVVRVVLPVLEVDVVERAFDSTGMINRAEAFDEICKHYLKTKRQHNLPGETSIEAGSLNGVY